MILQRHEKENEAKMRSITKYIKVKIDKTAQKRQISFVCQTFQISKYKRIL